jgi:hypothetical protein
MEAASFCEMTAPGHDGFYAKDIAYSATAFFNVLFNHSADTPARPF